MAISPYRGDHLAGGSFYIAKAAIPQDVQVKVAFTADFWSKELARFSQVIISFGRWRDRLQNVRMELVEAPAENKIAGDATIVVPKQPTPLMRPVGQSL